jgi:hypothetical protein
MKAAGLMQARDISRYLFPSLAARCCSGAQKFFRLMMPSGCHESAFVGFPIISHRSSVGRLTVHGLGADETEATSELETVAWGLIVFGADASSLKGIIGRDEGHMSGP